MYDNNHHNPQKDFNNLSNIKKIPNAQIMKINKYLQINKKNNKIIILLNLIYKNIYNYTIIIILVLINHKMGIKLINIFLKVYYNFINIFVLKQEQKKERVVEEE